MPRKCTCTQSVWTLVFEASYPVLWTGSCSKDWLSYSGTLAGPDNSHTSPWPWIEASRVILTWPCSGIQHESPKCWPNGDPSMLRDNFFVMKWDFKSTRLTQPTTFMTMWQLIEEHTERQGTETVTISSPSGVDWLRKTEVRNISKQVTVGHRDTRMSVLLKVMS